MPYLGNTAGNRFVASKAATQFSGDGSTTAFTLDHAVGSDEDILVSVDGVIQEPSVAYAVSNGTTLTFTGAPSNNSGNNIFVYYLFRTVATVDHPSTSSLQATDATFTGAVTANAGVNIDNITIDGTEIDLSSGDLTIDVAGDIILDADGGDVNFQDGGTVYGFMAKSSDNLLVGNAISDGDVLIRGNDGGSNITALSFDMSDGGAATLNNGLTLTDGNVVLASGHGIDFGATSDSAGGGSMTSELLDDYEEGTFTPGLIDSGGGLGANLTTAVGQYTKVGNLVTFSLRINGDARTSTGNQVYITNLPFTFSPATSTNRIQFRVSGINLGLDSGFYRLNGQLANTDTSLTILMQGTSLDNFRGHDLTPSYEIYVHGSYFTS
jgi:hypothetical protein